MSTRGGLGVLEGKWTESPIRSQPEAEGPSVPHHLSICPSSHPPNAQLPDSGKHRSWMGPAGISLVPTTQPLEGQKLLNGGTLGQLFLLLPCLQFLH